MPIITGSLAKYPARASFAWYASLIALGAFLLTRPACHAPDRAPVSPLDAAFTATSAACVTGLTVRSTGQDFSFLGQVVILLLIQLGGIGIMTVTTFITFSLGGRADLRKRVVLTDTLGAGTASDLRWVVGRVIVFSFACEGAGFVLLAARNVFDEPLPTALWNALFHSVAAFCNAGFGLFDDSLTRYQGDPLVNLTIAALIVTGGLGFPVILDIQRNWRGTWRQLWDGLHLHSKMMLIGTAALLLVGTIAFIVLEWDNALEDMSPGRRLLVALFQSVTCRTAGFNTVEIGTLTNATLFVMMLLMMVGAGPCSTGGGFKVSTLMTLIVRAWSTFHGQERVNVFRRTIPQETVGRATTTALVFAGVMIGCLTTLLALEQSQLPRTEAAGGLLDASFEVISALGTVGLSTGITPDLTTAGRIVIMVAMFLGRLGPISVFVAVSRSRRAASLEHPQEEPLIG